MKKYFLYLFITAIAVKANAQDGYQRTDKGTLYKQLSHNPGDKIKINDIITFQVVQKTEKDSVLNSTYATGVPAQAQVQPTGDLMDVFPLLALKDSVLVKVPTDSIFKDQESRRPPFFPKGSNLLLMIKIEKIQSLNEAIAERDREIAQGKVVMEKLHNDEIANTGKYITDHKLIFKTTASGLKYKITKPSLKRKPLAGDTLLVNYVGRTLDGKVFDTSLPDEGAKAGLQRPADAYQPFSFVVGHQEVIKGWDEGLLLLNEGSKATFLIPSELAYGERGAGEMIKPYSTLLFDIEVLKVTRGKHTPAAKTAVKPGAKKAPAKKPVTTKKKN